MDAGASVTLVRELWGAFARGDLATVEGRLAADARWRAVEDGPWNCEGREAILDVLRRQGAHGRSGQLETAQEVGGAVVVGVRPDPARDPPFALEGGVRYLVVTLAEGRIVQVKGCATRAAALAYAGREGHPPGSV